MESNFEKYLLSQGFEKFVMNTKTMTLEKPKRHILSTMVNLDHRYIKGDKQFIWGLCEKDRPATLIWPRPRIKSELGNEQSDDVMNRALAKYCPKEIIEFIESGKVISL